MGYKREYKTTIGKHLEPVFEADDPVVPEGDGWTMKISTSTKIVIAGRISAMFLSRK
jgi:hypothetical protein